MREMNWVFIVVLLAILTACDTAPKLTEEQLIGMCKAEVSSLAINQRLHEGVANKKWIEHEQYVTAKFENIRAPNSKITTVTGRLVYQFPPGIVKQDFDCAIDKSGKHHAYLRRVTSKTLDLYRKYSVSNVRMPKELLK